MILSAKLAGSSAAATVALTDHAIERYVERVRPACDHRSARRELSKLVPVAGTIEPSAPAWRHEPAQFPHLVIGDVAFPLTPSRRDPQVLVACTCLVRGWRPPAARRSREAARRTPRRSVVEGRAGRIAA